VGSLLRAILGGYEVDAFGNYSFVHEGARIFVTVGGSPIGPQVGVFSVTNIDVDLTPDLAGFLLTTNHTLGFGAFSYDADNRAVWLRHTLLGTTLDGPELQSAVAAVATTAARLDRPSRTGSAGGRSPTRPTACNGVSNRRRSTPIRGDPTPPATSDPPPRRSSRAPTPSCAGHPAVPPAGYRATVPLASQLTRANCSRRPRPTARRCRSVRPPQTP
jgi:hypothetical protein